MSLPDPVLHRRRSVRIGVRLGHSAPRSLTNAGVLRRCDEVLAWRRPTQAPLGRTRCVPCIATMRARVSGRSDRGRAPSLSPRGEAVGKTSPQRGASIGRGTTALESASADWFGGTGLSIGGNYGRLGPTVVSATNSERSPDSLRHEE